MGIWSHNRNCNFILGKTFSIKNMSTTISEDEGQILLLQCMRPNGKGNTYSHSLEFFQMICTLKKKNKKKKVKICSGVLNLKSLKLTKHAMKGNTHKEKKKTTLSVIFVVFCDESLQKVTFPVA